MAVKDLNILLKLVPGQFIASLQNVTTPSIAQFASKPVANGADEVLLAVPPAVVESAVL
jgi:hypothetical protein